MTARYLHRRKGLSDSDYARQERIRAQLKRIGYKLHRSRVRIPSVCHQGGYCVRSAYTGKVAFGECYEFSLDDLEMLVTLMRFHKLGKMTVGHSTVTRAQLRDRYRSRAD